MTRVSFPWQRRWLRSLTRSAKPGLFPAVRRRRLVLEPLEDRTLLTTWTDLAGAYNAGIAQVAALAPVLADAGFAFQIPLLQTGISRALDLGSKLQFPFSWKADVNAGLDAFRRLVTDAGFTVEQLGLTPDAKGDLLRLSRTVNFTQSSALFTVGGIGGSIGFSYFDDHVNGGLSFANLQAAVNGPVQLQVTFGVDVVNNVPQLFVAGSTHLQVANLHGSTHVTGVMNLRNLLNVNIAGDVVVDLNAGFGFKDQTKKLHLPDLTRNAVAGILNGSVKLTNVDLTTKLPIIPEIAWKGTWTATITNNQISKTENTIAPDLLQSLRSWVSGLFGAKNAFNFLSPILGPLNTTLPILNQSIGGWLGIPQALGWLVDTLNPPDFNHMDEGGIRSYLGNHGFSIDVTPDSIGRLIRGERVDLVSFHQKGSKQYQKTWTIPIFDIGIFGIADIHIDAFLQAFFRWEYSIGFGVDTTGFYLDPATHLTISGGVRGGLKGGLRVFGFDIASAEGSIGVTATATVGLHNPNPKSDRIYLDEIFRPGENLFQSFLNIMKVDFTIDLTADVKAKINLLFFSFTVFSHHWNLAHLVNLHITPHTTQTKRSMPLNLDTQQLSLPLVNGVLTIDGSAAADANLLLLSGADGTVDVNWLGHGVGHYTGVRQVTFRGGHGDDRLQAGPGFNVPLYAQGGSGNNYFEAGDGGSTLLGGSGSCTFIGGAGRDSLVGGAGNNLLMAGSGDSTLIGGGGDDTLYGGAGHDLLIGGMAADPNDATRGTVYIQGGTGNSTLWAGGGKDTLIAGSGTSELHGGRGDNVLIASATTDPNDPRYRLAGNDTVWGGAGNNTIFGGAGNDSLYGGSGQNIIQGGLGNNLIKGGPHGDLLMAGSGNDTIQATAGNNTLVAGTGEDWLYAGTGDDLFRVPFDVNQGNVRSHFFGGPGHDTLSIATDDADHFLRLTQTPPDTFTVTSYTNPDMTGKRGAFTFDMHNDIHGNFIQVLALEAVNGNNRLEVAPDVAKDVELIGGTGDDTLVGGGGSNTLYGGSGNDLLIGGPATGIHANEFRGGRGNATMIGGPGNDVFYGGSGDNDMRGGDGRVVMYGGTSPAGQHHHDWMRVSDHNLGAVMIGGQHDVTMYGGPGSNVLLAGSGTAEMHGGGSDDVLVGGAGAATLYGGTGYEVLIGGQGTSVLFADDPTRTVPNHSSEDWQTRFDRLAQQAEAVHQEINKVDRQLQDPNLPPDQRQTLQAEKDRLVSEHDGIVKAQDRLDQEYLNHTLYHVPNMLVGGTGPTAIHGSVQANFLVAGTGPATIYGGGGDDTIAGTAGKDTFVFPPLPGNANIVFTAQPDGFGNTIPVVTIDAGTLHQVEKAHVRGIGQLGVLTGDGNNHVTVDMGSFALYDLYVEASTGNNVVDFRTFQGKATVQGGAGVDTVLGGSPKGLELRGGSGVSTYEVDGTSVQVRAEGSPSQLSVYVNGQLRTHITATTFRRLLVQGQAGNGQIVLGPLGGFSFPELIAHGGSGSNLLDASAVSQRVTLLGGGGNDTLVGGSGPNYLDGGPGDNYFKNFKSTDTLLGGGGTDRFEYADRPMAQADWTSEILVKGAGDSATFSQSSDGTVGSFLQGSDSHYTINTTTTITRAHTFTRLGSVNPAALGPIAGFDFAFDFKNFDTGAVNAGVLLHQGDSYFYAGLRNFQSQSWQHNAGFLSAGNFTRISGSEAAPNFSASGAPLLFGLYTSSTAAPVHHYSGHWEYEYDCDIYPRCRQHRVWVVDENYWSATPVTWGLGNFNVVVHASTPGTAASLLVTASTASPPAGAATSITVRALDGRGNLFPGYRGTVHFTSTDVRAGLPADYTFTAADGGVHTFSIILRSMGNRFVSVAQVGNGFPTGLVTFSVLPGALDHFQVTVLPNATVAGTPVALAVQAIDAYGNVATGYRGTVHFTSSDAQAGLPADYTFTPADAGSHTFQLTPRTVGSRAFNLRDAATGISGGATVTVSVAALVGFRVMPATATPNAGAAVAVTVQAVDAFGNVVAGYRGAVHPPVSDDQAAPPDYTFTAADNGTHTFVVTFHTAGSRSIVLTDANTATLTGSAAVQVAPLAAVSLALASGWSATAGTPVSLTVTALDPYGNMAISYRGTVHFTADVAGTTLPPDYTFTAADNGVHTFTNLAFVSAVSSNVVVADKNSSALRAGIAIAVLPAAAASFQIGLSASAVTAGASLTITVTALDRFGNVATGYRGTVHATSGDRQADLPPDYAFTAADNGSHAFTVTLKTAGNQTVTLIDRAAGSIAGTGALTVSQAALAALQLTGPGGSVVAGTAVAVTVAAVDAYGNVTTDYRGTVSFTSGDSQAVLPPAYAFTAADNGRHTFSVTLKTAGSQTLTATDTAASSIAGRVAFAISPAAAATFRLTGPSGPVIAGTAFAVTLTAVDPYGNVATGYRGTIHAASSDAQATLPADYTFTAVDQGSHTFSVVLVTLGSQTLTLADRVTGSLRATATVTVQLAAAVSLRLTGPTGAVVAGSTFTVTVAALDSSGNLAIGYRGTVHFTSSDLQAVLPADYAFTAVDNGSHTFTFTLKTAGTPTLTATDRGNSSVRGSIAVTVSPVAATALQLTGPSGAVVAGTAFTVTATALDLYGNIATGYRGTAHFTSSDGQALLPADYTFTGADNGTHTFSLTFKTAGSQTGTIQDTANATLTSRTTVAVQPSTPQVLRLSGVPLPVQAGNFFDITVIALDAYGNLATSYTGTITFTSTDGQAQLPADYTFIAADHGMHTFSGIYLATAGIQSLIVIDVGTLTLNASATTRVTPAAASQFQVTTSVDDSSAVAGAPFDVTVTALDPYGNIDTNYQGTVTFSSQDPYGAVLSDDYTFTPDDQGTVTFTSGAALFTAGTWDVTVTDTQDASIAGAASVAVAPAAADHFQIIAPAMTSANAAFDVTLVALDPYGNVDVNYTGTVTWTTTDTDAGVSLPADYTFSPDDNGVVTFTGGFTLVTLGDQTLTVTDTDSGITGDAVVTVIDSGNGSAPGSGGGSAFGGRVPFAGADQWAGQQVSSSQPEARTRGTVNSGSPSHEHRWADTAPAKHRKAWRDGGQGPLDPAPPAAAALDSLFAKDDASLAWVALT